MWINCATKDPNVGEPFFNKIFADSKHVCCSFMGKFGGSLIENYLMKGKTTT